MQNQRPAKGSVAITQFFILTLLLISACASKAPSMALRREMRLLVPPASQRMLGTDGMMSSMARPIAETKEGRSPAPSPMATAIPPAGSPASDRSKHAGIILAVFDVQDASGKIDAKTLNQITEYLAGQVTEVAGYRVIPRNQLRSRITEEKKTGYNKCFDEMCQIELGKALAAQKSLATKLLKIGSACAISSTLYDLKTETTEKAASVRTNCSENGLMDGIEKIAQQLAGVKPAP
jgi:hypothetical protein